MNFPDRRLPAAAAVMTPVTALGAASITTWLVLIFVTVALMLAAILA